MFKLLKIILYCISAFLWIWSAMVPIPDAKQPVISTGPEPGSVELVRALKRQSQLSAFAAIAAGVALILDVISECESGAM